MLTYLLGPGKAPAPSPPKSSQLVQTAGGAWGKAFTLAMWASKPSHTKARSTMNLPLRAKPILSDAGDAEVLAGVCISTLQAAGRADIALSLASPR